MVLGCVSSGFELLCRWAQRRGPALCRDNELLIFLDVNKLAAELQWSGS
jgi:hypothetical protein